MLQDDILSNFPQVNRRGLVIAGVEQVPHDVDVPCLGFEFRCVVNAYFAVLFTIILPTVLSKNIRCHNHSKDIRRPKPFAAAKGHEIIRERTETAVPLDCDPP